MNMPASGVLGGASGAGATRKGVRRPWAWTAALGANAMLLGVLALAVVFALSVGRYPVSMAEILHFAASTVGLAHMESGRFDTLSHVIVQIRLPRVLTAVLVGAALSASGASFQAVFRNPLVSPGLLGVMGGASFGAALGILFDRDWMVIQAMSFGMGLAAVGLSVAIANIYGQRSIVMLVLGGVVSGGIFATMLSIIKYLADPENQLPAITYWLMGSLAQTDLPVIMQVAPPILIGVAVLSCLGKALDVMSMGDEEATALGVPVTLVRYVVILAATLVSALTVSIAGMVGWVGMVMPHIARLVFGPGNVRLIPAATIMGATFLVGADGLSRVMSGIELPIGIITEAIGLPVFLAVLHRTRRGWL